MFQPLFWQKIPFCPFWPKTVQNCPFGWMCGCVSLRAGNPWKTWKYVFLKPILSKFLSYFGKHEIKIKMTGGKINGWKTFFRVKNFWFVECQFVRTLNLALVRPFVQIYLEIGSLLFSETLQLVRTQKGGKIFQALFWKNPVSHILAKNCPKFRIFSQSVH